ncbi:glycosyltransferase [Helicobacter sp. Faydin-H64]|uniref:Glycosyltransferase n=2 Tax=Helicobacter turcicus TaxID=2867412 RepID=A0ABS7JPY5_9HELI|nr:glycosyltransferase [Helicobacter turcicus]MBX7545929.1 glycosyltransferase [Helicobacter turcicus]
MLDEKLESKIAQKTETQGQKCIVLVVSSLRMGGAEKVASFLANAFSGVYKVVLVLWNKEEQFYALDSRIKVEVISSKYYGILGNIKRVKALAKLFKEQNASLVISFIHQTNILAILASQFRRIPIIATEHSIYTSLSGVWSYLRLLTYPYATCITTLTHKDLRHYGSLKNVRVMPNPISVKKCDSNNCEIFKPYVLSVGRMIKSKHFDELLSAFKIFSAKHPEFTLLLIGDGDEYERLKKQAQELGIKVVFLGRLENLYNAYINAEFFALSSHKEGLSNVLIEALLCGIPVVSYDCPYGPNEIIEDNGYLVELGNVESLAEHFEKVLENKEILIKNTLKIKKRFDEKVVLEKWHALVKEFIV